MLKRNRNVVSRFLFFGFLGLLLLLVATTPAASQDTTEPPIRYQLYFNEELVAGTGVPSTTFRLDITDDGRLEPLHIQIYGGTGADPVYIHDFWGEVVLVQGMGEVYRYPQEGNYPVGETFPANQPDTLIYDQTIDVIAEAEAAGFDVPDPIYTGYIDLTIYIRYRIGGPPPTTSAQTQQMTTMQADDDFETFEDSVDVNVQDHYVVDPDTGEKRETTSTEKLNDQLSTPAGQATVGVTAVGGVALLFAGLQVGGVFPSFMSGIPSLASLGPGSLFGTTNALQNFAAGKLTGEARNRILSKMARAIKNRVRGITNCPSCAAKWSAPEKCPGCGLLVADLLHEHRDALKSSATRAVGILSEGKKATVSEVATKLGTNPSEAANIMSVLTEAGLLNFGVAAAGTGATTAAGVALGVALPQWLNLTGIAPMNLYLMIGLAALGIVVPLAWTKYTKKRLREKYQMSEVEEVPEELPEDAEDIAEMEEELKKVPPKETKKS